MKNFKKTTYLALITLLMLFSASVSQAQTLGTKKNITLKLMGYECSDMCAIEFKDMSSGFFMILKVLMTKRKTMEFLKVYRMLIIKMERAIVN